MPSTTALFTGLSGLNVNSRKLDVIGNNISNVNTTAYKSNRMQFAPIFSRNFSLGTAPSDTTGGTNPGQVGLGVTIAGTQRNFGNGSISSTGVPTDVAIEGDGMFIVDVAGEQMYTRSGGFQLNKENDLVTMAGGKVLGFGVDEAFEVVQGNLVDMNVPVGTMTIAEATENVVFNGNLNASGSIATTGSVHESRTLYTDNGLSVPATGNEDLTVAGNDLYVTDSLGNPALAIEGGAGTIITVSGIEKGGKDLGTHSFAFSATEVAGADAFGQSLNDFTAFLEDVLGLEDTNALLGGQELGGGVSINGGVLTINGNEGTVQDLNIESANFVASNNGAGVDQPFVMTKATDANGESVRTSYVVYDSLGSPVTVDLTFVLQETPEEGGTVWSFIAESSDSDGLNRAVGVGTVNFDDHGSFSSASNDIFSIERDNGAISPLTIQMDFDSGTDTISALTSSASNLAAVFQDGSPIGTLSSFSIGTDGVISGSFDNGLTRNIGQVALATFPNTNGLVDAGNNMFRIGPNSGNAVVAQPLEFGAGRLVGGALELSNVDLSQEFIDMILASTGYSAASRVITTTDELMDQLLVLGR